MNKKAVVVDDNVNNLLLEKDLLEVAGFEVFEAEDATGGIALTRKFFAGRSRDGRPTSRYARIGGRQNIASGRSDTQYSNRFRNRFRFGRGERRDERHNQQRIYRQTYKYPHVRKGNSSIHPLSV